MGLLGHNAIISQGASGVIFFPRGLCTLDFLNSCMLKKIFIFDVHHF